MVAVIMPSLLVTFAEIGENEWGNRNFNFYQNESIQPWIKSR